METNFNKETLTDSSKGKYLYFVSYSHGGHYNTICDDINKLESILRSLYDLYDDTDEEMFDIEIAAQLEIGTNCFHEMGNGTWFTITRILPSPQSRDEKKKYLVFTTDKWQSTASESLERLLDTLDEAHSVVEELLKEYGADTKVVVKEAVPGEIDFYDVEVYDYESGLEWKSEEDSDKDYGYLAYKPERFVNHYRCETCNEEWEDEWDAMCDDECPTCGAFISPYQSDTI